MNDSRIDRLYELLPVIYRIRDAEQGEPLRALLQIIAEQVNLIEDDIGQLYENWFIETCEDWVVPYIGELIGYEPVHEAGEPSTGRSRQAQLRNKILIPRREVANTIRYRRRKGTLALLELLSNDVAGWPARAVEFYRLLSWTQALNYQHPERGQTVDLRNGSALDLLDSPFDHLAHTADVRRINSKRSKGLYNIPSVGVFVWRLKSYPVTMTPAYCQQAAGNHCFTFSVLGNDSPLYLKPEPETDPTHIADEFNLPVPIRRRLFEEQKTKLYGEGKSLQIWLSGKRRNRPMLELVPTERIVAADLSHWRYLPAKGFVAVDPELGRIAFPSRKPPGKCDVLVCYRYGFSSELGGGEYQRPMSQHTRHTVYPVGAAEPYYATINTAIDKWRQDQAMQTEEAEREKLRHAVIEIMDSGLYEEDFDIALQRGESLQIRSTQGKRAVIGLSEKHRGRPESFSVQVERGSCLILDGVLVVGRPVEVSAFETPEVTEGTEQPSADAGNASSMPQQAEIIIRHSTLVPGWEINGDCSPVEATMASLKLLVSHLCVTIEHSIIGSIEVDPVVKSVVESDDKQQEMALDPEADFRCRRIEKEFRLDPIRICISDSILDATGPELEAIGTPDCSVGYAILSILRSTVFGQVQVHAIELAENCIFEGLVFVARRQLGCMRFCYVTPGSRTPRRYRCQPDLVRNKVAEAMSSEPDEAVVQAAEELEAARVRPVFNSSRYGRPDYCQLSECCAEEIKRGADDESEMGVFHDLFQPQRLANLRIRLDEYIPAKLDVGVILSS